MVTGEIPDFIQKKIEKVLSFFKDKGQSHNFKLVNVKLIKTGPKEYEATVKIEINGRSLIKLIRTTLVSVFVIIKNHNINTFYLK